MSVIDWFGKEWWQGLTSREKEEVVNPLIKAKLSNEEIRGRLMLPSVGMVASVRNRIRQKEGRPSRTESLYSSRTYVPVRHKEKEREILTANPPSKEALDAEEMKEILLCDLICGRWKPVGDERPFMQLNVDERRAIRRQIRTLGF